MLLLLCDRLWQAALLYTAGSGVEASLIELHRELHFGASRVLDAYHRLAATHQRAAAAAATVAAAAEPGAADGAAAAAAAAAEWAAVLDCVQLLEGDGGLGQDLRARLAEVGAAAGERQRGRAVHRPTTCLALLLGAVLSDLSVAVVLPAAINSTANLFACRLRPQNGAPPRPCAAKLHSAHWLPSCAVGSGRVGLQALRQRPGPRLPLQASAAMAAARWKWKRQGGASQLG
eukprot:SAG22_NODE_1988_length_3201_cov_3.364603_3_plen_232_part_00